MGMMKVSKWGNSLAVRLPAELVQRLNLKEGDYVEQDVLALVKSIANMSREKALEGMRNSKWQLPPDYKFDREEANSR
jgi:antitoxin MazE